MKNLQSHRCFLLFLSSSLFFACQNKEVKVYELNYPDSEWHWAAIQKQLANIPTSDPICCLEEALQLPNAKEIVHEFSNIDNESFRKYTIKLPIYKTNIYCNSMSMRSNQYCQGKSLEIRTIAFEDRHYLWVNIDAGEKIFWTHSDIAAKDSSDILFDYK